MPRCHGQLVVHAAYKLARASSTNLTKHKVDLPVTCLIYLKIAGGTRLCTRKQAPCTCADVALKTVVGETATQGVVDAPPGGVGFGQTDSRWASLTERRPVEQSSLSSVLTVDVRALLSDEQ